MKKNNDVITYSFRPSIELEMLDCNCNECVFMQRDKVKFDKWREWNKGIQQEEFEKNKAKEILEAEAVIREGELNLGYFRTDDGIINAGKGQLRVANKLRFQFDTSVLIHYGNCSKFNKPVSFIPGNCQIETQHCFKHRKDTLTLNPS